MHQIVPNLVKRNQRINELNEIADIYDIDSDGQNNHQEVIMKKSISMKKESPVDN